MNGIIIGNKSDTDLINIENFKKEYPNVTFTVTEEIIESKKSNLVIIMKELEDYSIKGKKSLFLTKEVEHPSNFFIISFDTIDVNISKIKHLIDIFLS